MKRVGLLAELSAALVQEQHRAGGAHDNQILPPIVVDVDKERAGRVFEDAYAGSFGDVLECAVAAIAIETVRKSSGLADVEIVESVAVDVANRNAVVSVDIDAASAVEDGAPVVGAVQQLRRVGMVAAERCGSHIDVAAGARAA